MEDFPTKVCDSVCSVPIYSLLITTLHCVTPASFIVVNTILRLPFAFAKLIHA